MSLTVVHLLVLMTLSCLTCAEDKKKVHVSCPEHQKTFGGSCFEFVGLQRTFYGAETWCEQRGGHLAFIPNEETQYFIQTHQDPEQDVWIGVAHSATSNLQHSSTSEGPFSWLDNSPVTFSKWEGSLQPGAACGHILMHSGFQWKATKDCDRKLHFICQFESGRSIVCAGGNTSLQCGSGQVLMIDDGFYGQKSMHYCRSTLVPLMTHTQQQCTWLDVQETLKAYCHGHQVCQVPELVDSFGEPCAQHGSYMSVDYHCKEVLTLSVSSVASVYDDVTIRVKWLLDFPQGDFNCKLSTGDGHLLDLHVSDGLEGSVVYKYKRRNAFVVVAECTHTDIHITAQKRITIQESITELGVIRCFSGKLSFHATDCKGLDGEPFQIEMEVKAGTNVIYRIQKDEMLLSSLSVIRENLPQNITVTSDMMQQLGPGCHQLTIYASNMAMFPETSADLQMCVLEKVAGLKATVLTKQSNCGDTSKITMNVSLGKGVPVKLLFFLTGDSSSFSAIREMNKTKDMFHIENPLKGSVQVKLRAWNVFSSLEVDVDMFTPCGNKLNEDLFGFYKRKKHIRVVRSPHKKLCATTTGTKPNVDLEIKLTVKSGFNLNAANRHYEWTCTNPCQCQGSSHGVEHIVQGNCLPDPFQFYKYHFNVIDNRSNVKDTGSICITFTPQKKAPSWLSLSCEIGCDPIEMNKNTKIEMTCEDEVCPTVVWHIEDPAEDTDWTYLQGETNSCYKDAKQRPLTGKQDGGTQYHVSDAILELAERNGVSVVITYQKDYEYFYQTYFIGTPSSNARSSHRVHQNDCGNDQTINTPDPDTVSADSGNSESTAPPDGTATTTTIATDSGNSESTAPPDGTATTTTIATNSGNSESTAPPDGTATTTTIATNSGNSESTAPPDGTATTTTIATDSGNSESTAPPDGTATTTTIATDSGNSESTAPPDGTATTTTIATDSGNSESTAPPDGTATTTTIATDSGNSESTAPPDGTATTITIATDSGNSESIANTAITTNIATTAFPSASSNTASNTINTMTSNTATTDYTSSPATSSYSGLNCSISPDSGTILDAFTINCNTEMPCPNCQYCFKTQDGKHLQCTKNKEVKSVFLPRGDRKSNYTLIIKATAKKGSFVVSTTITTKVKDYKPPSGSSGGSLSATVKNVVDKLKEQGQLTGKTVGQIFSSVSNQLNSQSDESNKAERQKLREQMLDIMTDTVKEAPSKHPEEVQVLARGLIAVSQKSSELTSSAMVKALLLLVELSSSLLHMDLEKTEENKKEMHDAASTIVEVAGNILHCSSDKNTSDALVLALENTQSALLALKEPNEGPTIIQDDHISVFVNRVTPGSLHREPINIPNCSCSSFHLPPLPSDMLPSDEPVDVRMLSLDKNPFSWNERGNISGLIGTLSLTTTDGSNIPVENLRNDIESLLQIFLPRPAGEQVNTSVLDLGNYSTTVINVPSANNTLVIKMVPSEDPLPFKVLLGYKDYPTETNHVAMTEMPLQGTTLEEKYTWLLDPLTLKGNTGEHYLIVRPIVGPGIKSIDASLSITPITSSCKFWDESTLDWSNFGCRVGVNSTHLVTQCLCNHLTFFGSSFFVTPNLVDPSRTAELFATFAENPVVVCFVGALFVAYLLAVVWARRKDVKDTVKVTVTVLEDNDPMDEYCYLLNVSTGYRRGASSSSQVAITFVGAEGISEPHHLTDPKKCVFERGAVDMFLLTTPFSLGDLQSIRLWHNNSGSHPAWYVGNVMVQDLQSEQKWHFLCNSWLAIDMGDCFLDKVFPVASEMELKTFSNLFFMKTAKDFSDGHLWYSVISRPPSSTFTCVQRVSCCFSLLLCTMLTSLMFYGVPTDPSEQTLDLGHFEFTWQQFMIGVQSSLIMFPVNILIVSIFRSTRPRDTSCCKRKAVKPQLSFSQNVPTNVNATLDTVIKDVTRIALSLSKTVKSNMPCNKPEFGPGQEVDLNAVLSVVDDFIKQNNKTSDNIQSKNLNINNLIQPQSKEGNAIMHPVSTEEGIQKKSNKSQYLYRQLCHIDRELTLLGPSAFPNPNSYNQALQQVMGMKGSLEDHLFKFSGVELYEPTQKRLNPADSTTSEQSQKKKKVCCHGGLPWWFIFIGWLLVIGTSVVAGYFTMLYGLKFGKERSVSWLVSQTVSFFQSVLVIQPLKVVCLAIFFALLIKKTDEEDFQNVAYEINDRNHGNDTNQQTVQRDESLYEPPPPADIEKMKRNRIMEQKAFALIKEILIYMGYMWMLLLVAHGQRDPNAFFLNRHIRHSFSRGITDSMNLGEVFTWANTSLLENLFGVYPGFVTDGNSKLVGNARLRQLRVQKNSCQIPDSVVGIVRDCNAPYSWEVEDISSYDPGWNHSVRDNISNSPLSPWQYQNQGQLRSYPFWGKIELYRGGGFVAELGPDFQNASSTLEGLFREKWLDMYTRAVFVEFTIYNANVNLFCIVTLLFETTAVGAFQFHTELQSVRLYQSTGALHIFVMAAEILYLVFILYYMFLQGKLLKQQKWAYFRSKWNIVELTIILLSWSALGVYIKRTLLGNRDVAYYQNHKDQFASFYETATADSVLQYLIAFLVLLSTIKLWHLLRLNPKMNLISATLERAWGDISSFLIIILIMLLAYSIASNVIYGWKLCHYITLRDSLLTIISLQIGIFNYNEVLSSSPWLGGLLIGSCVVFMSYIVLNLFISVILVAFNHEQIYHKPSDEEEIVDLMLKKICGLFGIRYKNTTDSREPDEKGDTDLPLNNSPSIPDKS